MKRISILLIAPCLLLTEAIHAQQSGDYSPATTENQPYAYCTICAGAPWDSTGSVADADGAYASVNLEPYLNCYQGSCYRSRYLVCYNFGFDIPANAIINGITVSVSGFCNYESVAMDSTIKLRRDALNNLWGNNMATSDPWSGSPETRTYGGEQELWGLSWTPQDINSPDFGVYLKLYNPTTLTPGVHIDKISISVTYSIGTSVYETTSVPHPLTVFQDNTSDVLHIKINMSGNEQGLEMYITDVQGNVHVSRKLGEANQGNFEEQISTSALAPGLYVCVVTCADKTYSEKFIVTP